MSFFRKSHEKNSDTEEGVRVPCKLDVRSKSSSPRLSRKNKRKGDDFEPTTGLPHQNPNPLTLPALTLIKRMKNRSKKVLPFEGSAACECVEIAVRNNSPTVSHSPYCGGPRYGYVGQARLGASGRPTSASERPASASGRPVNASRRPASASGRPASVSERPASASGRPVNASRRPASASRRPASASRRPASASGWPGSSSGRPASASGRPENVSGWPSSSYGRPESARGLMDSGRAEYLEAHPGERNEQRTGPYYEIRVPFSHTPPSHRSPSPPSRSPSSRRKSPSSTRPAGPFPPLSPRSTDPRSHPGRPAWKDLGPSSQFPHDPSNYYEIHHEVHAENSDMDVTYPNHVEGGSTYPSGHRKSDTPHGKGPPNSDSGGRSYSPDSQPKINNDHYQAEGGGNPKFSSSQNGSQHPEQNRRSSGNRSNSPDRKDSDGGLPIQKSKSYKNRSDSGSPNQKRRSSRNGSQSPDRKGSDRPPDQKRRSSRNGSQSPDRKGSDRSPDHRSIPHRKGSKSPGRKYSDGESPNPKSRSSRKRSQSPDRNYSESGSSNQKRRSHAKGSQSPDRNYSESRSPKQKSKSSKNDGTRSHPGRQGRSSSPPNDKSSRSSSASYSQSQTSPSSSFGEDSQSDWSDDQKTSHDQSKSGRKGRSSSSKRRRGQHRSEFSDNESPNRKITSHRNRSQSRDRKYSGSEAHQESRSNRKGSESPAGVSPRRKSRSSKNRSNSPDRKHSDGVSPNQKGRSSRNSSERTGRKYSDSASSEDHGSRSESCSAESEGDVSDTNEENGNSPSNKHPSRSGSKSSKNKYPGRNKKTSKSRSPPEDRKSKKMGSPNRDRDYSKQGSRDGSHSRDKTSSKHASPDSPSNSKRVSLNPDTLNKESRSSKRKSPKRQKRHSKTGSPNQYNGGSPHPERNSSGNRSPSLDRGSSLDESSNSESSKNGSPAQDRKHSKNKSSNQNRGSSGKGSLDKKSKSSRKSSKSPDRKYSGGGSSNQKSKSSRNRSPNQNSRLSKGGSTSPERKYSDCASPTQTSRSSKNRSPSQGRKYSDSGSSNPDRKHSGSRSSSPGTKYSDGESPNRKRESHRKWSKRSGRKYSDSESPSPKRKTSKDKTHKSHGRSRRKSPNPSSQEDNSYTSDGNSSREEGEYSSSSSSYSENESDSSYENLEIIGGSEVDTRSSRSEHAPSDHTHNPENSSSQYSREAGPPQVPPPVQEEMLQGAASGKSKAGTQSQQETSSEVKPEMKDVSLMVKLLDGPPAKPELEGVPKPEVKPEANPVLVPVKQDKKRTDSADKSIQVKPHTKDLCVMAKLGTDAPKKPKMVEMSVQSKEMEAPPAAPTQNYDLDEIVRILISLQNRPNPDIPDGIWAQLIASLAELAAMLSRLNKRTDVLESNQDSIIQTIKSIRSQSRGPVMEEGAFERIMESLAVLQQILGRKQKPETDYSQQFTGLYSKVEQISVYTNQLKKEHCEIVERLQKLNVNPVTGESRDYDLQFTSLRTMLAEILQLLRPQQEQEQDQVEFMYYDGPCRCNEFRNRRSAGSSKIPPKDFLPGLCQRCVNEVRGRNFLTSLSVNSSISTDLTVILGQAIQALMIDDRDRLEYNIEQFLGLEVQIPGIDQAWEALLFLAILWMSEKCASYLVTFVDIRKIIVNNKPTAQFSKLLNFFKESIESYNVVVAKSLIKGLTGREKLSLVNTSVTVGYEGEVDKVYTLFLAARLGNVEAFIFLMDNGAELDLQEPDSGNTILHEIIEVSERRQVNWTKSSVEQDLWNDALCQMLDVIYSRAGEWWEIYKLRNNAVFSTEASRQDGLRYLYSIPNNDGELPLEHAAEHASPPVIEKILHNPPFTFIPDPRALANENGARGFIVDDVDTGTGRRGRSLLEKVIRRPPEEAGPILQIEPLKSMIYDKWNRYSTFYYVWGALYIVYMAIYTACVVHRRINADSYGAMYPDSVDYVRLVGEIVVLAVLPLFLLGEVRDAVRNGWVWPEPWHRTGLFRITNLCFFILTVTAFVMRLAITKDEEIVLSLALLIGWVNALEYLGPLRVCGPFVWVLHQVFVFDLCGRFFLTFSLAFVAVSTATYVAFQTAEVPEYDAWNTPFSLYKMVFALLDADHVSGSRLPGLGVVMFIAFTVLILVLLFITLIAAMVDTYHTTRQLLQDNWIYVEATYSLLMDRRLPGALRVRYREEKNQLQRRMPTRLKYLMRPEHRRENDGSTSRHWAHAVLIPYKYKPVLAPQADCNKAPLRMTLDGTSIRGSMRSTRSNFRDSFRLSNTLPSRSNSLKGRGGNSFQNQSMNSTGYFNKVAPMSDNKTNSGYLDVPTMGSQPVQLQLSTTASI